MERLEAEWTRPGVLKCGRSAGSGKDGRPRRSTNGYDSRPRPDFAVMRCLRVFLWGPPECPARPRTESPVERMGPMYVLMRPPSAPWMKLIPPTKRRPPVRVRAKGRWEFGCRVFAALRRDRRDRVGYGKLWASFRMPSSLRWPRRIHGAPLQLVEFILDHGKCGRGTHTHTGVICKRAPKCYGDLSRGDGHCPLE